MIIIIRIIYAFLIVSTINTLLFFWPVTFLLGWSFASFKFFLFTSNKVWDFLRNFIVLNKEQKQYKKHKKPRFDTEEERKLYYLTKFNTIINKTLPNNIDKQANMSNN